MLAPHALRADDEPTPPVVPCCGRRARHQAHMPNLHMGALHEHPTVIVPAGEGRVQDIHERVGLQHDVVVVPGGRAVQAGTVRDPPGALRDGHRATEVVDGARAEMHLPARRASSDEGGGIIRRPVTLRAEPGDVHRAIVPHRRDGRFEERAHQFGDRAPRPRVSVPDERGDLPVVRRPGCDARRHRDVIDTGQEFPDLRAHLAEPGVLHAGHRDRVLRGDQPVVRIIRDHMPGTARR